MGMFDTIIVKDKLPWTDDMWAEGLPNACTDFQTKDLDSSLITYKIENGKLLEQKFKETTWVEPDPEVKDEWNFGRFKQTGEYWAEIPYHGILTFADYNQNNKAGNNDCYIEFQAKFTNGVLDKIEVSKFEKTDNTKRVEAWNKMQEERAIENARWINLFFFHTKLGRIVRRGIHKSLYHIGKFFIDLSYKF